MSSAPVPAHEEERLRVLASFGVLDTAPDADFDALVGLASRICETPIALVSLVDHDRQWFKARVGLDATQTSRDVAFCSHAILHDEIFTVGDAREDERFADNPLVTGPPGIRFYAGAPLSATDGLRLGTLCVIDTKPRELTELQCLTLRTLADQVQAQLELRRMMRELARHAAEVRAQRDQLVGLQRQKDELIALVVHDLKSPLGTVLANAHYLLRRDLPTDVQESAHDVLQTTEAMHRMVMNILDISRSEDGALEPELADFDLAALVHGIAPTRARARDLARRIEVSIASECRVIRADPDLLRRVLENLLDNALKYAGGGSIRVDARPVDGGAMEIRVTDEGPGVPPHFRERVFEKYARLERGRDGGRSSRGLGLVFCRRAIEAHGGRMWIEENSPSGSVFCMRLPEHRSWKAPSASIGSLQAPGPQETTA